MINIKTYYTHTGKIYVDEDRHIEFLTVGDYGKENNIKADFLNLRVKINGVKHKEVDLSDKWVATISTQKGCPMSCLFCDCPKFGFYGNVSVEDLKYQIETILKNETTKSTKRFNVHFARMGEPTFNPAVLSFANDILIRLVNDNISADTVHPVLSTMLPKNNKALTSYILDFADIKNNTYHGNAGIQFSINSTNEDQRNFYFNNCSESLLNISSIADKLPYPKGRKYTLNFPVTKETIINPKDLSTLFDKDKFIVKITPIHQTNSAVKNHFDISDSYQNYDVYEKFENPLVDEGWQVIIFVPSEEEDSDRITCGNAIISDKFKKSLDI